jgi:Protein of unknown function (DUF2505)
MDVRAVINYPGSTTWQVYALVVDPEFRRAVCDATGALEYLVTVEPLDDGNASVTVSRSMPADVPEFVRRFVGERIEVVQTEKWGPPDQLGQRTAELAVRIKGQPARLIGTISVEVLGSGARQVISGDVKVSIPIIGRRIEHEMATAITAAADVEEQLGRTWIDKHA